MAYKQAYVPNSLPPVLIDKNTRKPLPMRYGDPIYSESTDRQPSKLIGRVGMAPVITENPSGRGAPTITFKDDPKYQKSQKQIDFEKQVASGKIKSTNLYGEAIGSGKDTERRAFVERESAYTSYDPKTNIVRFYDPEGNITQEGQRTSGNIYGGGVLGSTLSGLSSGLNKISADPNFQRAVTAAAIAVVAPYATAQLASSLSGLGAYAGVTAQAITSITIQVAQGVPIEKAIENALVNVALSGATGEINKQIGKVVSSDGVKNAITSTVSSGLATAAKGGSQADVEKAMTAGLVSSAASTAYKDAVDSTSTIASKAVGGAAGGAVTGGTEGAVIGGLTSTASALGSDLAADLKDKDKTVTDTTVKDGGGGGDTTVKDGGGVVGGEGGGGVGDGDTAIGELSGKDLIELAEDSATLIGPADPSTASLDTGVVSDAGTGFNEGTFRVDIDGAPYQEGPSTPQNIRDLVPEGYHLATSEEIDRIQKSQGLNYDADGRVIGSIPENLFKATLLSNGEYAWIAPNITSESLVSDTLPTTVIPSIGEVTGVDLTASEVDTVKPETAVTSITGTPTDSVSDITTTAPVIEESATVIRVDPSTETALVINSTGDIFTVTVDPSTTAGSTVTVPTNTSTTTTAAETVTADPVITNPVTTATTDTTTAADTVATTDTKAADTTAADTTAADTTTTAADTTTTAADTTVADTATTDTATGSVTTPTTDEKILELISTPGNVAAEVDTTVVDTTPVTTDTTTTSDATTTDAGTGTGSDVVVGTDTGVGTGTETSTTDVLPVSDIDQRILDLINPATTDVATLPVTTESTQDVSLPDTTPVTTTGPVTTTSTPTTDQEILDLIAENPVTTGTTTPVDAATTSTGTGTGTTTDTGTGTGTGTGDGTGTGTGTSTGTGDGTGVGTGTDVVVGADTGVGAGTGVGVGDGANVGTGTDVVVGADTGTGTGVGDGTGTTNVSDVSDTDQRILDLISENPATTDVAEVGDVTTTIDQPPVTDLPVITDTTTDTTTVDETPITDTSLVDTSTVSDADQEILDLISEELETDTTTDTTTEEEDSGTGTTTDTTTDTTTTTTKPDIFTTIYLSPKKTTTSSTSALGSALGTTGLTASRGAGEIEAPSTGKARKKVWNEESLKLKDALGV